MIELSNIDVSYDRMQVIWDVSLELSEEDTVVSLVGPNGAGKSTLMKTMSGLHPVDSGSVTLWGDDVADLDPGEIVQHGFVLVSEERNLFGEMSVRENLEMGAYRQRDDIDARIEQMYDRFPILEERSEQRAGSLSGGEQQMLAIARGLMSEPKILALDEPSEGLAPQITDRVFEIIDEISDETTILLVEQHVDKALDLADRAYLLENGQIVHEDTGQGMLESDHVKDAYL
ncbi:amino acid/amide ABC transporter ATP-binding protein 2, HAAT family [Halopenitus malekzadehii]|uniref:Amino acid/amide ABC transporter ATP-binding protein 2, HAAT family n=1 Tax=Halopenitus malekzadehii TaxID=1267564 RepID=A0A1H6HLT8_9EURY|nr:ABC transporter ATP-binding protein [Halopenitus malekzadehii]SEH36769.1 amino acid/amide ABC transporter ATP-binding protein 2, HAAT family [Halopenitus malekzadehii]